MEDSTISTSTKESETQPEEINLESFLQKISAKLSINKKIFIYGKVLLFLNEKEYKNNAINFSFKIFKNTDINPFTQDVLIDLEFIPDKTPHGHIRSDFTLPSLYDNRNIYFCLTNESNYKYNPDNLKELEEILENIVNQGIENFLQCINDNITIKTFVYYGEYNIHSIYNINDFLENSKLIKFYRVNQILGMGKKLEEKYLIVTQLHVLILNPQEKDKTFAELIFIKSLRNIIFNYKKNFNQKLKINTLILYIQDIKTPNGKIYEMEFTLIDRSRPPVEKEIELDSDDSEEEINQEKNKAETNINNNNDANKNINDTKVNNTNNASSSSDKSNNNTDNNKIQEEQVDVWDKYYQFEEEIEKKQKEIDFNKFKLILESYRPLFNHRAEEDEKKGNSIENKNNLMEYEKMFQYCEKMYNYYEKLNDNKKYKKRMDFYMVNINFMCAELMQFYDLEKANFQFYFDKMKFYLDKNEKKQNQ